MRLLPFAATAALALFVAAPMRADEVNIYSLRQPDLFQPLIDAFTAETGIAVNLAFIEGGMKERLVAEGSRTPADMVLSVDGPRLVELAEAGVLQPVDDPVLKANIPPAFRGTDDLWFGLSSRARVVYASKDRVKDGEVTTYEALTDPKWKGRICTRSGTSDYNVALMAAMIAHHGAEYAEAWAAGVKANLARRPVGADRDQVKAIWAGQCDISLGNTYYMAMMLADPDQRDWAEAVRIVFPTFEDGGTHMNISGVGLTKAAPHKAAAIRFMEWLSGDEAQGIYATINNEFPVKPGVPRSPLVAGWGDFAPDTLPMPAIAKERAEALKLMEDVDFDG